MPILKINNAEPTLCQYTKSMYITHQSALALLYRAENV